MVNVMGAFRSVAVRILSKNGIVDPRPDRFYPHTAFMGAFRTIGEEVGPNTLYQIGRQVALEGHVPPQIATPEDALGSLDLAYYSQHRGGDIGHYHYVITGERSGTMVC